MGPRSAIGPQGAGGSCGGSGDWHGQRPVVVREVATSSWARPLALFHTL